MIQLSFSSIRNTLTSSCSEPSSSTLCCLEIKSNIDALIESQGKCDPEAFFAEWYKHREGYAEYMELADGIQRWNGKNFVSPANELFTEGVAYGTKSAKENLSHDAYKTLYINDKIGLHDRQHTKMLKLTGLQKHLAGIGKV